MGSSFIVKSGSIPPRTSPAKCVTTTVEEIRVRNRFVHLLRFALRLHQRLVYGGRSFLLNAWIPFLPPSACSVSGRGKVIGKNVDVLANCVAGYRYGVEVLFFKIGHF